MGWCWRVVSTLDPRCDQSIFTRTILPTCLPVLLPGLYPCTALPPTSPAFLRGPHHTVSPLLKPLLSVRSSPHSEALALLIQTHQRLQRGQAHPEASGLWALAGPPLAKPVVRDPLAPFCHLKLSLRELPWASAICLDSKPLVKGQTQLRDSTGISQHPPSFRLQ